MRNRKLKIKQIFRTLHQYANLWLMFEARLARSKQDPQKMDLIVFQSKYEGHRLKTNKQKKKELLSMK